MIASNSQLRAAARASLRGHWTEVVILVLLLGLVMMPLSWGSEGDNAFFFTALSFVVAGPLEYAVAKYFLDLKRGKKVDYSYLLSGFKQFTQTFSLYIIMVVKVFLWSLLLLIPGIIAVYRYSQAYYLLRDNPRLSASEALAKSSQLMSGHKWKLFTLHLSFLGWAILAGLTMGIGFLWLAPYMEVTGAHFYDQLIGRGKAKKSARK